MNTRHLYINKVMMASGLSSLLLLLTAISALAHTPQHNDNPYRVEEFSLSGQGNLHVRTSGGHIAVEASESNRVRVEMYVSQNGRTLLPSDTDLSEFEIDISQSGNKISAIARRNSSGFKLWDKNTISVSFVVHAPKHMNTNLKTSGGHIETRGLSGTQKVSTSGGHLQLTDLQGSAEAKTSGGHINVQGFEGDMKARTSGGHITIQDTKGALNVRTSGGHITLTNVSGTLEGRTSGGNVTAELKEIGQSVRLHTSGGNVSISVPDGVGLDLDLRGSLVQTQLKNFSGKVEHDEVAGSINGGGPKIAASTSGGIVSIFFQ